MLSNSKELYPIEKIWHDWRTVDLIGSGTFGIVYEICRKNFGVEEHCALKVIPVPSSSGEYEKVKSEGMDEKSTLEYFRGVVDDFMQEIRLMSELKGNTNIVSYEDHTVVEHSDKRGWDILIRMELLTPFNQWFKEHPFHVSDVIKLGIQLCNALEYCAKNSIIHRDIKPDNIFVTKNGDYKLGDFGVARIMENTESGSVKGTYTYMAPEVYRKNPYGATVDICSLGIVMYCLLNYRRAPFEPEYPKSLLPSEKESALRKRMNNESTPAPYYGSQSLIEAVLCAFSYEPSNRWSHPEDFADRLKQELLNYQDGTYDNAQVNQFSLNTPIGNQPEPTDPDSESNDSGDETEGPVFGPRGGGGPHPVPTAGFKDFLKKNKNMLIIGGVVVPIAVGGLIIYLLCADRKEPPPPPPPTEPTTQSPVDKGSGTATAKRPETGKTTAATSTTNTTTTTQATTTTELPMTKRTSYLSAVDASIDLGNYFYLDKGIFVSDAKLFGKRTSEIMGMFNVAEDSYPITSVISSSVDYSADLTGFSINTIFSNASNPNRDDQNIEFQFCNDKLVKIVYNYYISSYSDVIDDIVDYGRSKYGNENDTIFFDNTEGTGYYYIWDISERNSLLAITNTHSDLGIEQCYISKDFHELSELLTMPCDIEGTIVDSITEIPGYTTSYVVEHGKKEEVIGSREYLYGGSCVYSKREFYYNGIIWYEVWEYGSNQYCGWIESKFLNITSDNTASFPEY